LPLVTFLATWAGWQAAFAVTGAAALANAVLCLTALPRGVRGAAISRRSWSALAGNRAVLLLLLLTVVQVSAQFIIFTYLAPLLTRLAGAGSETIAAFFSVFGVMGFVGNLIATRLVTALGPFRTSLAALGVMLAGFCLFGFGAGALAAMGAGIALWGFGFAAHQLDAAGPPRGRQAGPVERDGRPQHLRHLRGAGDRLRRGRLPAGARPAARAWICGRRTDDCGARRAGAHKGEGRVAATIRFMVQSVGGPKTTREIRQVEP
jgi:hypothetical protein